MPARLPTSDRPSTASMDVGETVVAVVDSTGGDGGGGGRLLALVRMSGASMEIKVAGGASVGGGGRLTLASSPRGDLGKEESSVGAETVGPSNRGEGPEVSGLKTSEGKLRAMAVDPVDEGSGVLVGRGVLSVGNWAG